MAKATSDQQYHENPEHWGEDQYVTLQNVIDNILITADDDSYFKHSKRFRASIFGKQGIKALNVDVGSQNKAISIQLSPDKIFPYPRYMTNWSRVFVINDCDKLHALTVNNNGTIQDYMQDNEWLLTYDINGDILKGADFNAEIGDCQIEIDCESNPNTTICSNKIYDNSWVKDVKDGNYFEFSEDLVDKIIVIEFQTAGLETVADCDIKIHHNLEDTITRFIQWNLLLGKRNVPLQEVAYYHSLFKTARKKSKNLMAPKISAERILKSISLRYS